jgi:hypothetical protein
MRGHLFRVGDFVRLRPPGTGAPGTVYHVRQCLPAGPDGDLLYRVKAAEKSHERIAWESDLLPLAAPQGDASGDALFGSGAEPRPLGSVSCWRRRRKP